MSGILNPKPYALISIAVLIIVLPAVSSQQSNPDWWPMFHHDLAHSGYSTSNAPNITDTLWKYKTSSGIFSSPTTDLGIVYFGSEDSVVYALNATNGMQLWNFTTGGGVDSSPAVSNGKVFFGSYDGNLYALDALTGAKI
jgi:outer membrane protein assembly factor BamB